MLRLAVRGSGGLAVFRARGSFCSRISLCLAGMPSHMQGAPHLQRLRGPKRAQKDPKGSDFQCEARSIHPPPFQLLAAARSSLARH